VVDEIALLGRDSTPQQRTGIIGLNIEHYGDPRVLRGLPRRIARKIARSRIVLHVQPIWRVAALRAPVELCQRQVRVIHTVKMLSRTGKKAQWPSRSPWRS